MPHVASRASIAKARGSRTIASRVKVRRRRRLADPIRRSLRRPLRRLPPRRLRPRQHRAIRGSSAAAATAQSAEDKFGYRGNIARAEHDKKEAAEREFEQLTAKVAELSTLPHGELQLTLDNGQVWQQKPGDRSMRVKVGDEVTIKRGSLGSFLLTSHGQGVDARRAGQVTRAAAAHSTRLTFSARPLGVDMRNELSAARVIVTSWPTSSSGELGPLVCRHC